MIRNYRKADGQTPNKEGSDIAATWILSRRFFVYDTISGISDGNGYSDGSLPPKIVRWASSIELKVKLDTNENIYRPYMIIDYKEAEVETLTKDSLVDHKLTAGYFSDYLKYKNDCLIALYVLVSFGIILTGVRFYSYTLRNPTEQFLHDYKTAYSQKFLFYLLDVESEIMYWVVTLSCIILLLTYKN